MFDQFTYTRIPITPEIGMALKNFRIEHNVTATTIIRAFEKSPTYITKLEKGDIRHINATFLIELCDFITQDNNGLIAFVERAAQNYFKYTSETQLILKNIDELLIEHPVSQNLISMTQKLMQENKITTQQLADKINENEDIKNCSRYDYAEKNRWDYSDHEQTILGSMIKLDIPADYIEDLLEGYMPTIHYVVAEGILYSLYRLINHDDPRGITTSQLEVNGITRHIQFMSKGVKNDILQPPIPQLAPDSAKLLEEITSRFQLILTLATENGYAQKRVQQICNNLSNDLGLTFAFMSLDLGNIHEKDKEVKKKFLSDVKELIDKYSTPNMGFDMYE